MSILLQKDDLNLKNEIQKIVEIKDYEEKLKFELIEYFSKEISFLIKDGSYQDAIDFVQNRLNTRFEIPLKQKEKDITGNLNELILNEKTKFKNFFIYLKNELLNCKKFYFIVSFIRYSGLQILLSTLDELEKKGIKGEIITSVYLNITDSKSLRKLLSYKNIKVKIYNNSSESFHTKAYLFEKNKYHTCIIGS